MKTLATMLLAFSLPGSHISAPLRSPVQHVQVPQSRKGGQWYFAENGHAVYCYGPVMTVADPRGGLQKVATFCQGTQSLVPLKD